MTEQLHEAAGASDPAMSADSSSGAPLIGVGQALRHAREARGLSLSDVAQTLKLGSRQIEALERDDWSVLPGPTFVRGFVRNYSRLLEVDPGPLMGQLDMSLEKPKDTLAVPDVAPKAVVLTSRSRDGAVVGVGALLLVLAALAYFLMPGDLQSWRMQIQAWVDGSADKAAVQSVAVPVTVQPQEPLFPPGSTNSQLIAPTSPVAQENVSRAGDAAVNDVAVEKTKSAQEQPVVVPPVTSPVMDSPLLRLQATKESWVEIRDRDQNVILSRRLAAGAVENLNGKAPFSIVIGYAAGMSITWRDQAVDLVPHSKNNVARLVLE